MGELLLLATLRATFRALLAGTLMAATAGCSQPWQLASHEPLLGQSSINAANVDPEHLAPKRLSSRQVEAAHGMVKHDDTKHTTADYAVPIDRACQPAPVVATSWQCASPLIPSRPSVEPTFTPAMHLERSLDEPLRLPPIDTRVLAASHLACPYSDSPAFAADEMPATDAADWCSLSPAGADIPCGEQGRRQGFFADVCCDYHNYYHWQTAADFGLVLAFGAVLANTSMDDNFQGWYQRDMRSPGTDDLASFWKTFGEGHLIIPSVACLALAGAYFDDWPLLADAGGFGARATRAYLVGAPPMLLMQYCLGGSRPGETSHESQWKPFDDNNAVSGHAFIGAVPFITLAMMTDNPWNKATFYLCSTLTGYSRINDNAHYLSQVCLGWTMAYLACRSINQTDRRHRSVVFTPVASPEMSGMMLVVSR